MGKERSSPGPGPRPPLVAGDTEQFFCWLQTLGPQTQCNHCSVFSPSCLENQGGLQLSHRPYGEGDILAAVTVGSVI